MGIPAVATSISRTFYSYNLSNWELKRTFIEVEISDNILLTSFFSFSGSIGTALAFVINHATGFMSTPTAFLPDINASTKVSVC